jgi:UDP-glucose 4-epimerase
LTRAPVLVTGSSGLVGEAVVHELLSHGHPVVAFDLKPLRQAGVTALAGDVRDLELVKAAIRENAVRSIIHLAARIGVLTDAEPHLSIQVNVMGTSNVLEAARIEGVRRVVFASSIMRQAGRGLPHMPGDYPAPRNLYGATKLVAEFEAELYRRTFSLDPVVVAISATLGARRDGSIPSRSPHVYIIENAAPGAQLEVPADPSWSLPVRRASQVARILAGAALRPQCRPFYHTGGRYTSVGEIADEVSRQLPGCVIRFTGGTWPTLPAVDSTAADADFGTSEENLQTLVAGALAERPPRESPEASPRRYASATDGTS